MRKMFDTNLFSETESTFKLREPYDTQEVKETFMTEAGAGVQSKQLTKVYKQAKCVSEISPFEI